MVQRISLLAGVLVATVICFIFFQSATQEVETQTEADGGSGTAQPTYSSPSEEEFATGRIIVSLEEEAAQADLAAINRRNDASIEENLPASDVSVVDLPRDLPVQEAVQRYEASPDVEYAEPDFVVQPTRAPNDPYYTDNLYGLNNIGQTGGLIDADVDAPEAWDTSSGDPRTVVAVIDEGVDTSHPDLKGNIWVNADEVPDNRVDDDSNGYVDDLNGYDFANDDATVYDADPVSGKGDEHGTHVAGTVAAKGNNGIGVTGINWQARIMVLKFLGPDGGYTSDAIEALNYAVNNGAKISNNSWGGGGRSQALQDAIAAADSRGHLFVAAAGNGGSDGVGDNNDVAPNYPASYDNPNIISVAATDDADRLASFSNYGAHTVDLGAPGVSILSTLPGDRYGWYSGTSMATPHVTGVAALIKSRRPELDDAQLRAQILQYVDKQPGLEGKTVTGGRLNLVRALTQEADVTEPVVAPPGRRQTPGPGTAPRLSSPRCATTVPNWPRKIFASTWMGWRGEPSPTTLAPTG